MSDSLPYFHPLSDEGFVDHSDLINGSLKPFLSQKEKKRERERETEEKVVSIFCSAYDVSLSKVREVSRSYGESGRATLRALEDCLDSAFPAKFILATPVQGKGKPISLDKLFLKTMDYPLFELFMRYRREYPGNLFVAGYYPRMKTGFAVTNLNFSPAYGLFVTEFIEGLRRRHSSEAGEEEKVKDGYRVVFGSLRRMAEAMREQEIWL